MSNHQSSFFVALVLLSAFGFRSRVESEEICRYCVGGDVLPPASVDLEGERYHYAPDRQVDVLHIKLDVTPNFQQRTVAGTSTITAKIIARPLKILRLDAVDLQVKAVRCDGAEVEDFVSSRTDLQIAFAAPLQPGQEFTLHIDYTAEPIRGLYFRTPEMGYPKTDAHIWTQGEAHEARFWFPCFDYPNERSSSEVVCHVPNGMTVLSNGKRMGEDVDGQGLKVVRWLQQKPHVNYLICLVAGHFASLSKQHGDIALGFYTQPTLIRHAENSFRDTPEIMAFLEEEIGVAFPWDKYDQVTIRDFTAGGMENTSMTTLTHRTIFSNATENIRTTRRLDAHEMTHQWFGDYVTCKDWSHLWLNEGFATYYTHLFEGHKFGADAMKYGLYRDAETSILTQKDDKKPIVYNEYKNAMQQFDYRAYPKGSWVLHMLRSQLGEDLYRRCIKAYLEKHALTSVVSDDLRKVIEEQSGQTMDRFFDQWLYHARHPDLEVTYKWMPHEKLARVTIKQTQKVDDAVMLFHFPTKLRFIVDGLTVDHDIEIREEEHDFYVALAAQPSIVRFDPEMTVLADVSFDKPDQLVKAQLENKRDMIGRLLACKMLSDRKTHESVEMLSAALSGDEFFGVRIEAAKSLEKHDTEAAHEALRKHRHQTDARVRLEIVKSIANHFDDDTPKLIDAILKDEKNPAIMSVAIEGLGRFHGRQSRKTLLAFLGSDSFRNELADASIAAIRSQNDPSYKKALLNVLRKREDQFTSRGFGQGLVTLAHVAKTQKKNDDVREFLVGHLNHPKLSIKTSAIAALGTLGDPKAISLLEAFVASSDSRVSRPAQEAVDRLRDVKPTAPKEVVELRKEVAEMKKANTKFAEELEKIRKQLKATETATNEVSE